MSVRSALLALAFVALAALPALPQGRTDVVFLRNGDRITGEVKRLERGRLELKTDDAGTLDIEWDNVASLAAARVFEVATSDGRRFFGSLAGDGGALEVTGPAGEASLPLWQVTSITPIGASFWKKLDGSIDAGFSYTKSSGVAQVNVNSDTVFRRPRFEGHVTLSLTATEKDDGGGRDDRGSLEVSYVRYRWQRWFVGASGQFESNESLGLRLRSQIGVATGPRLVNTNRSQVALGGGLVVNDERGVDVEGTQNLEALLFFDASFFTYDRPRTNVDARLQYYPSLSNAGRQRLQLDAGVKREVWKDLFVALNVYDTYDSRPPNPTAATNDIGIIASIGWSY